MLIGARFAQGIDGAMIDDDAGIGIGRGADVLGAALVASALMLGGV